MEVVQIKFAPWDKVYNFDPQKHHLKKGDYVIVRTNLGMEIGRVVDHQELDEGALKEFGGIKPVIRRANLSDLEKIKEKAKHREEAFLTCQKLIKKYNLPMKLTDVRFSFDGGRITFAFIAKEKVDFRELVRDLSRHFQKSIRLYQINVREEARMSGNIGPCGRKLCCLSFLKNLGNITLDTVYEQQVAHRGIERLSGVCGRLCCCLAFELETYRKYKESLPPLESEIKTKQGKGKVIAWHVLKQTVDVRTREGIVVEVPVKKT